MASGRLFSEGMRERYATGETLRRFLDRVFRDLQQEPLAVDPDEHRRRLAELLARAGAATHYEVLELSTDAAEGAVHPAYRALARWVHPCHAAAVGLDDREGVLEVLFERATEAYLVLSDPDRRRAYDRLVEVDRRRPADPEARAEEVRRVAGELQEKARDLMERDEPHFAVELLRQAVRLDPAGADTWALLGRAQRQNPRWLHMAGDSLRRALRLQPDSVEYRLLLAEVEELQGLGEEAERRYRQVLERTPDHPAATEALERLKLAGG